MSVETNKLRGAGDLLEAVTAALRALQWRGAPAFARVEIIDRLDWETAITRLTCNENRGALVTYLGDTFTNRVETAVLTGLRTTRIGVVITERILGEDVKALTGDATRPGALGLLDTLLPALTGEILPADESGKNSIFLTPTKVNREGFTADAANNFPGRSVLILHFEAAGAWLQVGVGENDTR